MLLPFRLRVQRYIKYSDRASMRPSFSANFLEKSLSAPLLLSLFVLSAHFRGILRNSSGRRHVLGKTVGMSVREGGFLAEKHLGGKGMAVRRPMQRTPSGIAACCVGWEKGLWLASWSNGCFQPQNCPEKVSKDTSPSKLASFFHAASLGPFPILLDALSLHNLKP